MNMNRPHGPFRNGKFDFPVFAATTSNQITYEYFCLLGGLENPRCEKVLHRNGTYTYYTYHRIDSR